MWFSRYVWSCVFLSDLTCIINIVMNFGGKTLCRLGGFEAKLSHTETGNLTLDNRQTHSEKN